jgi:hypothetical protein
MWQLQDLHAGKPSLPAYFNRRCKGWSSPNLHGFVLILWNWRLRIEQVRENEQGKYCQCGEAFEQWQNTPGVAILDEGGQVEAR